MKEDFRIGGVSCKALADIMGTPLFIYDEDKINNQLSLYKEHFKSRVFDTEVLYAGKAFLCEALLKLLDAKGFSLDVVSGGELHCAYKSKFPMERVYFHGNNKTVAELEMAMEYEIGGIILDNIMEAEVLIDLARKRKRRVSVLLRVNPGIEAHTHKYIMTSHLDSKFGISIRKYDDIIHLIRRVRESHEVIFEGFHCHIGSQIFDINAYMETVRIMTEFIQQVEEREKMEIITLNLGGGFAALYTDEDRPIPIEVACEEVIKACEKEMENRGLHLKKVMIEPGRSLVAESGYTLYQAGYSKDTETKKYIFVDGGMSDNIRPALYEAKYHCNNISRADVPKTDWLTVAGKCCESSDILIENILMPETKMGDLILFNTTGAYGYSMASNYNRIPRPAVVFVKDGKARCVIRRETYEDMERYQTDEEIILND
ncbi:MAG: diaminopimelate decarboxylase [Anaerovoracaceae bacterium]|jgi:diaminopimelate decarboxylase